MLYEREMEEQRRREAEEAAAKAAAKSTKRTRVGMKNYDTLKPTRLSLGPIDSSDSENEMITPMVNGETSVKMMSSVEGFYDDDS